MKISWNKGGKYLIRWPYCKSHIGDISHLAAGSRFLIDCTVYRAPSTAQWSIFNFSRTLETLDMADTLILSSVSSECGGSWEIWNLFTNYDSSADAVVPLRSLKRPGKLFSAYSILLLQQQQQVFAVFLTLQLFGYD